MNETERNTLLSMLADHLVTTGEDEDKAIAERKAAGTLTEEDYDTLLGVCEMALADHRLSQVPTPAAQRR